MQAFELSQLISQQQSGNKLYAQAGSIVCVAKKVEHKFHSIEEELRVIAFFAPAEGSNREP
jgi:hypothetical protein